ncbi:MAG: hypothetical protein HYX75_20415 [Acidobacteria bacterium]|nr:hypothetical protein [Acidobacteriota bacterium]
MTISGISQSDPISSNRVSAAETKSPRGGQTQLDESEKQEVQRLKEIDSRVKAHEQAHLASAGGYARGGAQYKYETGPDGRQYAVSGEVSIDTSEVPGNPEATLRKAEVVKRAALAPADPSGQDRRVAAEAEAMAIEARREISAENSHGTGQGDSPTGYGKRGNPVNGLPASTFIDVSV